MEMREKFRITAVIPCVMGGDCVSNVIWEARRYADHECHFRPAGHDLEIALALIRFHLQNAGHKPSGAAVTGQCSIRNGLVPLMRLAGLRVQENAFA